MRPLRRNSAHLLKFKGLWQIGEHEPVNDDNSTFTRTSLVDQEDLKDKELPC